MPKAQRTFIEYGAPAHRGRLVQRHQEVLKRTAKLAAYHPKSDTYGLRGHTGTELF